MTRRLQIFAYALVAFLCATAPAFAQSINLDMGNGPTVTARIVQTVLLITVLSLAPSILVMVTSFTRIIVVLAFLRTAMGTQTTPPNIVLISLAMFLTMFIMQPSFDAAWENCIRPMMNNQLDEETGVTRAIEPFRDFMLKHTRLKDLALFTEMSKPSTATEKAPAQGADTAKAAPAKAAPTDPNAAKPAAQDAQNDVSIRALIPAFMISELRRAFEIGFMIFLPFLIIDMVVASLLMSMGMMMLPPSMISLPFKIIFFVLVDGWYLICGSLIQSY
jgi:flagellar biosynthetic protein FliP